MRRMLWTVSAVLVGTLAVGCQGGGNVLSVDLNGKRIEIHEATEVRVPKGNESQYVLREKSLRVAGQEPIAVIAGSREHALYTTDTTINIDGKQIDMAAGEMIVITPDEIRLPTMSSGTPAPAPSGGQ